MMTDVLVIGYGTILAGFVIWYGHKLEKDIEGVNRHIDDLVVQVGHKVSYDKAVSTIDESIGIKQTGDSMVDDWVRYERSQGRSPSDTDIDLQRRMYAAEGY